MAGEYLYNTFNNGINVGRSCWLVAGTFCDHQIMGTFYPAVCGCRQTGGAATGDYAAEILRGKLANMPLIPSGREEVLSALAVETDGFILATAEKDTTLEGMGTTLLCVFIREGRAYWVHVGDSRLSVYRKGVLRQLTEDQNLARYLVEEGEITPEEVADHYSRNILDQALGSLLDKPETGSVMLEPGDILVLSTDGFHNLVLPEQIVAQLLNSTELKSTTDLLINIALKRGGMDNITLVLARYSTA